MTLETHLQVSAPPALRFLIYKIWIVTANVYGELTVPGASLSILVTHSYEIGTKITMSILEIGKLRPPRDYEWPTATYLVSSSARI